VLAVDNMIPDYVDAFYGRLSGGRRRRKKEVRWMRSAYRAAELIATLAKISGRSNVWR